MQVKQLDHLNLSVEHFDATVDWYGRVFGFALVEEDVQEGVRWGVLRAGEAMLCIYEHPELTHHDADTVRADHALHGIAHFGLRITDPEGWAAIVEREGLKVRFGGPIRWPHSTAWYIHDPTGYEIEVAAWNGDRVAFDAMVSQTPAGANGAES